MKARQQAYRVVVFLVLVALAALLNKWFSSRKAIRYPNFGIEVPAGYTVHGIDVSRYQRKIDWQLVSQMRDQGQKISFAIIKATEGTSLTDKYFDDNWDASKKVPMLRGAYMYFHPGKNPKAQAQYFISKVSLEKGDLPPVVDIEETNGLKDEKLRASLQICLDELEKEFDVSPIIYTNVDFYEKRLGSEFDSYPLWAAHYQQKGEPRIQRKWHIWQHSDQGNADGIEAKVDFNVVNGSISVLQELCL